MQSPVADEAIALCKGVLLCDTVEIVASGLAKVAWDQNPVSIIAADLVVVNLDRLVDLAERDVDFAQEEVLVVHLQRDGRDGCGDKTRRRRCTGMDTIRTRRASYVRPDPTLSHAIP